MRQDMYKVIVERPRVGGVRSRSVRRLRNDVDGPAHLGMRAYYVDRRSLNENLSPLRRYLHAQVGRPWSKVYAEICARIDRRNTVQRHIHQHIDQFIAIRVELRDGHLVNLDGGSIRGDRRVYQRLYVDPRTGLVRINKTEQQPRRKRVQRQRQKEAETAAHQRVLDTNTLLLKLAEDWFEVKIARMPANTRELCYDVVMRRQTARKITADTRERLWLYGCQDHYAAAKRQLSKHEIKEHGLRA
jgi:hypothetical protein